MHMIKVLLRRNFHFFFPTVFLKNVKYGCKLREITMNRVRLNIFCLDITLQKSQKLVRHCFVRKPRVRCILHQRVCFVTSSNQPSSRLLQKYTETFFIYNYLHIVQKWTKNQCGKISKFEVFCPRDIESCHLAAARCGTLWSLNANLFFKEPQQLSKFT